MEIIKAFRDGRVLLDNIVFKNVCKTPVKIRIRTNDISIIQDYLNQYYIQGLYSKNHYYREKSRRTMTILISEIVVSSTPNYSDYIITANVPGSNYAVNDPFFVELINSQKKEN